MWHRCSWRRSPLAPLHSCRADDSQTGEQLCQRSSHIVAKFPGLTTDFPTSVSGKRTENPQGSRLLEGIKKTLCTAGPRVKEQ